MNRTKLLLVASAFALSLSACQQTGPGTEQGEAAQGTELGIVPASMDKSVKPGDDFYTFANGRWMKSNEIPADRSNIGGFYIADQLREKNTRELLDGILKEKPDANSADGKIANYYNAYLNTDAIDRAGMAPAKADLDAIAGITDKTQLSSAIGANLRADTDPLNATNFRTEN